MLLPRSTIHHAESYTLKHDLEMTQMNKKLTVIENNVAARTVPQGKLNLVPKKQRPALNYSSGYYDTANKHNLCSVQGVVMSRDDAISWDMQ